VERETLGKEESKEGHGFGKEGGGELSVPPNKILRMGLLVRRVMH
jgi:hypothetical protein